MKIVWPPRKRKVSSKKSDVICKNCLQITCIADFLQQLRIILYLIYGNRFIKKRLLFPTVLLAFCVTFYSQWICLCTCFLILPNFLKCFKKIYFLYVCFGLGKRNKYYWSNSREVELYANTNYYFKDTNKKCGNISVTAIRWLLPTLTTIKEFITSKWQKISGTWNK